MSHIQCAVSDACMVQADGTGSVLLSLSNHTNPQGSSITPRLTASLAM